MCDKVWRPFLNIPERRFMRINDDNFIMLPTVDFCFKELMQNPKVRQGFIAALLRIPPEEIGETVLLPTILRKEYEDDKLGILDVRIMLRNGTQMDMEMQVAYFAYWEKRILFYLCKMFTEQLKKGEPYENLKKCIHVSILDFVFFPDDDECYRTLYFRDDKTGKVNIDLLELQILELQKLPADIKSGEDLINWMRFFSGKSREEFEEMAKTNEYLDEAYNTLMNLSADEQKRLEYEAREKAIKDYNSQMNSARRQGEAIGRKIGREIGERSGEKRTKQVFKLHMQGKSDEEIAEICSLTLERVREILE